VVGEEAEVEENYWAVKEDVEKDEVEQEEVKQEVEV